MPKLLLLSLMFLLLVPALAKDNEAEIKATLEDRYKEWIAAANKKDVAALTDPPRQLAKEVRYRAHGSV